MVLDLIILKNEFNEGLFNMLVLFRAFISMFVVPNALKLLKVNFLIGNGGFGEPVALSRAEHLMAFFILAHFNYS